MKSINQLEIPKRSVHCLHKGEHFIPGMEIYSLIHENEEHQLGRADYCAACWQEIHRTLSAKAETRGYWKSKIEPRKNTPESSRIGRALKLLKELKAQPDANEEEIFVLCLFLSHARQLALRQEFKEEGSTYQLYEILRQEEFLTIKSLNLSQLQIEVIQKSLAQKLNGS